MNIRTVALIYRYYILLAAPRQYVAVFCLRSSLPTRKKDQLQAAPHLFSLSFPFSFAYGLAHSSWCPRIAIPYTFLLLLGSSSLRTCDFDLDFRPQPPDSPVASHYTMEASFGTTMDSHPQQVPLGIINMLISRRTLIDSISRSLEVLYEMPYTTEFPPGLPSDLEQILRDLHASTERLIDEVTRTNRLLHRLAMFPPHALPTQPWLPHGAVLPHLPPPYGSAPSPSGTTSTS